MNSVLLIGNKSFTASVIAQVRGLDALTLTTVTNAPEASRFMEKTIPDVVIAQANQLLEGSVFKTFRQERHSVYFVVIEDTIPADILPHQDQDPAAVSVEAKKTELMPPFSALHLSALHLEKTAGALEAGADAYLWLPPYPTAAIEVKCSENCAGSFSVAKQNANGSALSSRSSITNSASSATLSASPMIFHRSQSRLIQAHIQMGLNRAQRYRDLSRINDWLSAVALVDALTQLSNRRAFDLEFPRQVKVARAKGTPLSMMVVDIDFFKSVNDRYGHLVGDDVLKLLAKRLLANMRFYDAPFRYGGEEFVITLSNTDLKEGLAIAERLRRSIAQVPFQLLSIAENSGYLPITVSIGLTELRADDDDRGRSFLHRADQQLLKAKGLGRNQVVSG